MEATRYGPVASGLTPILLNPVAGLYLHIPPEREGSSPLGEAFARAISRELDLRAPHTAEEPVSTVYVGGCPSALCSAEATRILAHALRAETNDDSIEEATVEIRPTDASNDRLKELHRLGVTRLSIKSVSLAAEDRTALDESPSVGEVADAIERIRQTGFRSVSVDLQFGGPGSSLSNWKVSLQRAVELRVPHIALHEREADDEHSGRQEERAEYLEYAMIFLKAKGYEQYELTHFARPGHRSHHQQHYYAHGNYLGLGPGAESFWWPDRSANTTAQRWSNVDAPESYVECLTRGDPPVAQRESLNPGALAREYVLLRLRTNEGLNLEVLATQYGVNLRAQKSATLHRLAEEGLIQDDPDRVRLTHRGRLLADAITLRLLPSGPPQSTNH